MTENRPASKVNVESPCTKNCCLNNEDICLGCYRHLEEIRLWSQASDQNKQAILFACEQRKNTR